MADEYINQVYTQSTGAASTGPFVITYQTRDPTVYDVNWPNQKLWVNTTNDNLWTLDGFTTTAGVVYANWLDLTSGKTNAETLTGNSGGAVGVDGANNINVIGDTTTINIVGVPGTHTLTASTAGSVATTYTADSGTAVPSAGNLNVFGSAGVTTSASGHTVTVAAGTTIATSYVTNSGTATPSGNVLNLDGTQGVTTTGSGNTVTVVGTPTVAAGSSSKANLGTASFSNADFSVDSNGYVTIIGGAAATSVHRQVFTTTGTYTPTSGMLYCDVQCVGGGGGGGGSTGGSAFVSAGAGGGAGGFAQGIFSAATIGASKAVTIGAAGAAGAISGGTGGTGGTSSLGVLISATGGVGGLGCGAVTSPSNILGITGGAGGTGTGGDYQLTGQQGTDGYGFINAGTGIVLPGVGGASVYGGAGTPILNTHGAGYAAVSYGSGGAGSGGGNAIAAGSGYAGGAGFQGIIIITEYVS